MASSPWIKHVAAFRKSHPGMDPKKVFGEAAKTFKKSPKQRGGLSDLGSSTVVTTHISDLAPQVATRHGGKKSKRRGRGSKRSTKKRSTKKRSTKRRH